LADIGLLAPAADASAPDARVDLASLADVTYVFDEAMQTIDFTAAESARARLIVDARHGRAARDEAGDDANSSGFGVLVNYDIYAGVSMTNGGSFSTSGPTGSFEAKLYSPFGLVEQSFALLGSPLTL